MAEDTSHAEAVEKATERLDDNVQSEKDTKGLELKRDNDAKFKSECSRKYMWDLFFQGFALTFERNDDEYFASFKLESYNTII